MLVWSDSAVLKRGPVRPSLSALPLTIAPSWAPVAIVGLQPADRRGNESPQQTNSPYLRSVVFPIHKGRLLHFARCQLTFSTSVLFYLRRLVAYCKVPFVSSASARFFNSFFLKHFQRPVVDAVFYSGIVCADGHQEFTMKQFTLVADFSTGIVNRVIHIAYQVNPIENLFGHNILHYNGNSGSFLQALYMKIS